MASLFHRRGHVLGQVDYNKSFENSKQVYLIFNNVILFKLNFTLTYNIDLNQTTNI